MEYASSKDRFKREFDGIQVELQATDPSENKSRYCKRPSSLNTLIKQFSPRQCKIILQILFGITPVKKLFDKFKITNLRDW